MWTSISIASIRSIGNSALVANTYTDCIRHRAAATMFGGRASSAHVSAGQPSEDRADLDRLVAFGADGDEVDGGAEQLFDAADEGLGLDGQVFPAADVARRGLPAGVLFVDRGRAGEDAGAGGEAFEE